MVCVSVSTYVGLSAFCVSGGQGENLTDYVVTRWYLTVHLSVCPVVRVRT